VLSALVAAASTPGPVVAQDAPEGSALVATYDDGGITVEEFVKIFRQTAATYADQDMSKYKSEVLIYMVTNELLGREAMERGFVDEKGEWNPKVIAKKEKAMVNQLRRDVILKGVTVSEDELREMYDRSATRRLTRLITVSNREDADMVMEQIESGADFLELVDKWSLDLPSAAWKGLLAWVKIGDGPENLEQVIFGLDLGEVGGPVETLQGYSIVRLDSLYNQDDMPEYDEARPYYRTKALERKRAPVNIAFMDSVARARGIVFNEDTIALAVERFEAEGWIEDDEPGRGSKIPEFTPEEFAMNILSYDGGSANLGEYLEYVDEQIPNPAYFLAGREEMDRGLSGFARRNLELQVAYEMGMDEVPSVRGQVRKKAVGLGIVDMMVDVAGGEESVKTTDEDRRAFYEDNKWKYTEPGAIVISIVSVTDRDVVDELYEDMNSGVPIDRLAEDYRWVLDEGRTSGRMVLTKDQQEEHPEIFNTARRMRVDGVSEPIPIPGRGDLPKVISVIRLLEREPSMVLPYEDVMDEVRVDLNLEILSSAAGKIEEFKQRVREKYNYEVNEEILNNIKL
jgi:hypothetical protein